MAEIILSFFAVIGFVVFAMQLCDYVFYRKFKSVFVLWIDLGKLSEKETVDSFEMIATVRQNAMGRAVIGSILVLDDRAHPEKRDIAIHYMKFFHIPGEITTPSEPETNANDLLG